MIVCYAYKLNIARFYGYGEERMGNPAGDIDFSRYLGIPYDGKRHPEKVHVDEFIENPEFGSNCQLLAVGMLKLYEFVIPDSEERIGSKELWSDVGREVLRVDRHNPEAYVRYFLKEKEAFDIFFFWPPNFRIQNGEILDRDLKKLHVGLYIPVCSGVKVPILHNYRGGESGFWECEKFSRRGYGLFSVKRPSKI